MFENYRQTDYISHIMSIYPPELIKALFINALRIDVEDNNDKADIVQKLLGDNFSELGTGTNRYAVTGPDGMCHKIALDRRGIVDNMTELKRSPEIDFCSPKVYECNGVILVAENVKLIQQDEFIANRDSILYLCGELAKNYIFTDIGYQKKNYCNWGIRRNGDLVILDTGYIIPRLGNEEAMQCPFCGQELAYDNTYTGFYCKNKRCQNVKLTFADIYRRINTNNLESKLFAGKLGSLELPDFDQLNNTIYDNGIIDRQFDDEEEDEDEKQCEENQDHSRDRDSGYTVSAENVPGLLEYLSDI